MTDIKELRRLAEELDIGSLHEKEYLPTICAKLMSESADHIESQEALIAELRKDAERYQWAKRNADIEFKNVNGIWIDGSSDDLDKSIDELILSDASTQEEG